MAEPIRLRAWVAGLLPIALVIGGVVWLATPKSKERRSSSVQPTEVVESAQPASVSPPSPEPSVPVAAAPTAGPPPTAAAIAPARPAPSGSAAPPPEPIPELDAFYWRPSGSEQWTDDQKRAHIDELFANLDAREKTLEQQAAAAERAGDTATAEEKRETLSYLRARRAELRERLRARGR